LLVEPTSAVALAALGAAGARPGERVVVAATGHGLKTPAPSASRTTDPGRPVPPRAANRREKTTDPAPDTP
ncbi:hypothetical protein ACVU7I_16220, partial [Patulibacter sp. S7RM1-6]